MKTNVLQLHTIVNYHKIQQFDLNKSTVANRHVQTQIDLPPNPPGSIESIPHPVQEVQTEKEICMRHILS